MCIRIIGVGERTACEIEALRRMDYISNACQCVASSGEIAVNDTDKMALIFAYDNFGEAENIAGKFRQAGVLTLGDFPEYLDQSVSFDAQTRHDGAGIRSMIEALVFPVLYPGPISFDFNDIHTTLSQAHRFTAWSIFADDMDSLLSNAKDYLGNLDLNNVERACINLYPSPLMELTTSEILQMKTLTQLLPTDCQTRWGMHHLPDPAASGLSIILTGREIGV